MFIKFLLHAPFKIQNCPGYLLTLFQTLLLQGPVYFCDRHGRTCHNTSAHAFPHGDDSWTNIVNYRSISGSHSFTRKTTHNYSWKWLWPMYKWYPTKSKLNVYPPQAPPSQISQIPKATPHYPTHWEVWLRKVRAERDESLIHMSWKMY